MNDIFTNWKYNGKIILTTKENDFHCSISSVKVWLEDKLVKFSLLEKNSERRQVFQFELVKGIDKLEVWTASGKYWQHSIDLPNEE